jgi:peptide/nickel transport system permease protein
VLRLFGRRLVFSVFVLWGITLITFILSHVVPGNPALLMAGPHASAASIKNISRQFGLNLPLPVQYWHYLDGLIHGQLGFSFVAHRSVDSAIALYLPASVELGLFALVVGTVVGIVLGVMTAERRGSVRAVGGQLLSGIGLSMPTFWLALLLQLVFYYRLGWLPGGGRLFPGAAAPPTITHLYLIDSLLAGQWSTFVDAFEHLLLPGLSLAASIVGLTARVVRTSMLDVLTEDYLRTATAKGLRRYRILFRYSLRNAILPLVTIIGLEFAGLAGGVFLVENIYSWPGIGRFAILAIEGEDYNAIIGITFVIAVFYVVANFIVDNVYLFLDPRIRAD